MRICATLLTALLLTAFTVRAGAHDPLKDETLDPDRLTERLQELSEDFSRQFVDDMKRFLDREMTRLEKYKPESRETLERKLEAAQKTVRDEPENARAHYEMGELYDRLDDGAAAIIHTRIAERLFVKSRDVKGAAEARRNLRYYFQKYEFEPEDFVLSPAE